MKKRVYIAGPISKGDLAANVNRATAAFVRLAKAGFAPLCPHWSVYSKPCKNWIIIDDEETAEDPDSVFCQGTKNGNDEMTHADWIGVDLPWVEVSHAVLRLPGESTGADLEVEHATRHGVPVYEDIDQLIRELS